MSVRGSAPRELAAEMVAEPGLEAFVPQFARHFLRQEGMSLSAPTLEKFPAAVLFADISGFSTLAEELNREGPEGAESLKDILNLCFGPVIELIAEHGGEAVKFAGDATLAVWRAGRDDDLATILRLAAQCGLAIQRDLDGLSATESVSLRLRVGIGIGRVLAALVGGVEGRWEAVLAGAPLDQMARACDLAPPGEVILAPEAWRLIEAYGVGRPVVDGFVRLEEIFEAVPPPPSSAAPPPAAEELLRAFVPRAVQARLRAGQAQWLAEFRHATVMFVEVGGIDYSGPDAVDDLQRATVALQESVYRYGGSVNQLVVDDKGTLLIAVWGLALHSHENSKLRGVLAARTILTDLQRSRFSAAIGLASGRVFSGWRGNHRRMEFAVIGDVVNLSARLMQAADDCVLCDEATRAGACQRMRFEELPAIEVKGKDRPVVVHRPIDALERRATARLKLIGRYDELETLSEAVRSVAERGRGGLLIVEGEPGIGKSRLVAELLHRIRSLDLKCYVARTDGFESSTAYHTWRRVLPHLLGWDAIDDPEARQDSVLKLLAAAEAPTPWAGLLNPILGLDLPEHEMSAEMSAESRAEMTRSLLTQLIVASAGGSPAVLVLEDAHWMDQASQALAEAVHRRLPSFLMIIVTRPLTLEETTAAWLRLLRQAAGGRYLKLEALAPAEVLDLACDHLGTASLPPAVARLIQEKAAGNPFFIEELAIDLRDREVIAIIDGQCRLAIAEDQLDALPFPDTVQEVVAGRIDRLTPEQQLTLKVASVIGRVFDLPILAQVHPLGADPQTLRDQLAFMTELELIRPQTGQTRSSFLFKQPITQEVAYDLLPFAQRRQLHFSVGSRLEIEFADDPTTHYPLLAHHWRRAAQHERAIGYLSQAGEQSLASYENRAAVRFFTEALELDREAPQPPNLTPDALRLRRGHWQLQLGQAYVNDSRYDEGRLHLEKGLSRLALAVPATPVSQHARLLAEWFKQALHHRWPHRFLGRRSRQRSRLLAATRAFVSLVEVYYYSNERALCFYSALRTLNLAEVAGTSPELAHGYANVGAMLGYMLLRDKAEGYLERALETADEVCSLPARVWAVLAAGLYQAGIADWRRSTSSFEELIEISQRLGDYRRWFDAMGNLSLIGYFRGDFAGALDHADELYAAAARIADSRYQIEALRERIYCLTAAGSFDRLAGDLERLQSLVDEGLTAEKVSTEMDLHGHAAVLHLRRGERDAALALADEVSEIYSRHSHSTSFYSFFLANVCAAEVYSTLREDPTANEERLAAGARQACRALRSHARVFPVAQASAWRYRGLLQWTSGHHRKAIVAWKRSLELARAHRMPYDEGKAHYELGRHLPANDPDQRSHLTRAREVFGRLQASFDLRRTCDLLNG